MINRIFFFSFLLQLSFPLMASEIYQLECARFPTYVVGMDDFTINCHIRSTGWNARYQEGIQGFSTYKNYTYDGHGANDDGEYHYQYLDFSNPRLARTFVAFLKEMRRNRLCTIVEWVPINDLETRMVISKMIKVIDWGQSCDSVESWKVD